LRVDLHARLGRALRAGDAGAVEALEDEAEDRFGEAPAPLRTLFALARLSARCRRLGVARLEVGPNAAAATPRDGVRFPGPAAPLEERNGRVLLRRESATAGDRLAAAEALLAALAQAGRRARHAPAAASGRSDAPNAAAPQPLARDAGGRDGR
jgi:transcription-repair coupling factor (superfamily II helicase)